MTLSLAERGAYITLLAHEWESDFVPGDDPVLLARAMICEQSEAAIVWPKIQRKFRRNSRGKWTNKRLELERQKQKKFSKAQSDKGKRGGRPKSRGFSPAKPRQSPLSLSSDLTSTGTSRLTPRLQTDCGKAVENTARKASAWKRAVAIAHAVIEAEPNQRDWSPELKHRLTQQGIDAYEERDGRPLYVRALDYVMRERQRRAKVG